MSPVASPPSPRLSLAADALPVPPASMWRMSALSAAAAAAADERSISRCNMSTVYARLVLSRERRALRSVSVGGLVKNVSKSLAMMSEYCRSNISVFDSQTQTSSSVSGRSTPSDATIRSKSLPMSVSSCELRCS